MNDEIDAFMIAYTIYVYYLLLFITACGLLYIVYMIFRSVSYYRRRDKWLKTLEIGDEVVIPVGRSGVYVDAVIVDKVDDKYALKIEVPIGLIYPRDTKFIIRKK